MKNPIRREATRPRTYKDMNLTTTPAAILAELEEAQKDLALFQRLETAQRRTEQLTEQYEAARANQEREEAEARDTAKKARFKDLSNVRVTGNDKQGSIWRNWRITFTGPAWDMRRQVSRVMDVDVPGFSVLLDSYRHVFDYLIEECPERIPAEIMALAPGDPYRAFEEMFAAERRGYLIGRASN